MPNRFIQVQLFDPIVYPYEFESKPFWVNLDNISKIIPYDVNEHAEWSIDLQGNRFPIIPDGAGDTIYITIDEYIYHLNPKSSKDILYRIENK